MSLDVSKRVDIELHNRIRACWAKFHQHRRWLTNLEISARLRMRLFDATCTPSILFGTAVLPLNLKHRRSLDILQRKMLRLIVGWRRSPGEEWEETMRRMNRRIEAAQQEYSAKSWEQTFHRQRWRYAAHVLRNIKMKWPYLLSVWNPADCHDDGMIPYRKPGRPYLRWDDSLHAYCGYEWSLLHWTDMEAWTDEQILKLEDRYVQYCML